jgi:muramoyltetrapeptide carboxypeptidase
MITPRFLKQGDKVGIVASGRKVKPEEIDAAVNILSGWGLKVELAPNLFSDAHRYLAGQDESRISDFQKMIDDPEIAAIICARGGYGTTRIIDRLNLQRLLTNPKWIAGFSDITTLHLRLNTMDIESIHSTMGIFFSKEEAAPSVNSLRESLYGKPTSIAGPANKFNKSGSSIGEVIGGNLSLLVDSLSTSSNTDFNEKILIVEEIDEYLYKIDRMVTHLLRAGKLSNLRGLAIGYFSDLKDTTPGFGETVEEIILDKVGRFGYPVAFNLPIGHENPNLAWISGSSMTLNVDSNGSTLSPFLT